MKAYRIEKRLPFGFVGDWGKLYKRFTAGGATEIKPGETVTYEKNHYRDIGQDVQFKRAPESTDATEQPTQGLVVEVEYAVAETTDAYFDDAKRVWKCIVRAGDIVRVFGRLWVCAGVRTITKHNPAPQAFYYCDLKSIL